MARLFICVLMTLISTVSFADNSQLLNELDSAIARRAGYLQAKEDRIAYLKKNIVSETNTTIVLKLLDALYDEYYVYKLDSAMVYAKKGLSTAVEHNDTHFITLFTIHMAEILNLSGLYSEAVDHLNSIQVSSPEFLFKYYYTYFSVYSYWSDYCDDHTFSPLYRQKATENLKLAMQYADENDPLFKFYQGEHKVYVEPDIQKAREFYHNILKTTDEQSRIYAMASYALAGNYHVSGDDEKYEEYLIRAALSDLKC